MTVLRTLIKISLLMISGYSHVLICALPASAQPRVVPDDSLGTTVIEHPNSPGTQWVRGGFRPEAGANLFHSFREFGIPEGRSLYFAPDTSIENIVVRITGRDRSDILGTLGVDGGANLFLLNPNGIVFGRNARLDVNGSFLATTAERIEFEDGTQFHHRISPSEPLLTMSVPVGLQFGPTSGAIVNQSRSNIVMGDLNEPIAGGLRVPAGHTLALVGNRVTFHGGMTTANSGRIELGSVAENSDVGFTLSDRDIRLNYGSVHRFQDIALLRSSLLTTSGEAGGPIQLYGRQITVAGSRIESNTLGRNRGGDVRLVAAHAVVIRDAPVFNGSRFSNLRVQTLGPGNAGNLWIETRRFFLEDNGQISASTFSSGQGGNVAILAEEFIRLSSESRLLSQTGRGRTGSAGILSLQTQQLTLNQGAEISASTFSSGEGGAIAIDAEDIQLAGPQTRIISEAQNSIGDAGSATIRGGQIHLRDGATLSARTQSAGSGGELTLMVRDVWVQGGAQITVQGGGAGPAGNLTIQADSIQLENGRLIATTVSGQGANIRLEGLDLLLMRDQSRISAQAFQEATGGNIFIDAPAGFVSATPTEDNDILASAVEGAGGRIDIRADSLLGLEQREPVTPLSDINASSEFGPDGIVDIRLPEVTPDQGVLELPDGVVDVSGLIDQNACRLAQGSEFVIVGRRGLPSSPQDAWTSASVWEDLRPVSTGGETTPIANHYPAPHDADGMQGFAAPVEAQGWVIDREHHVMLIPQAIAPGPQESWTVAHDCLQIQSLY